MHFDDELYKDKNGNVIGGGWVPDSAGTVVVTKEQAAKLDADQPKPPIDVTPDAPIA